MAFVGIGWSRFQAAAAVTIFWTVALAGCSPQTTGSNPSIQTVSQPQGVNTAVTLYRGVRASVAGQIDWTRVSFGVSGQPTPTLSLFNGMVGPVAQACWLSVSVTVDGAVNPGVNGALDNIPAPGTWNPGPWAVNFDDNPAGHWSIAKATIGGVSNNQASDNAAAVFHSLQTNGHAQVINGTNQHCHA